MAGGHETRGRYEEAMSTFPTNSTAMSSVHYTYVYNVNHMTEVTVATLTSQSTLFLTTCNVP